MANFRRNSQKKRTYKPKNSDPTSSLLISLIKLLIPKKGSSFKGLIKFFRWAGALAVVLCFLIWSGFQSYPFPIPSGNEPPILYSNQCDDDLRGLYVQAINEAKDSIFLRIYSLTDSRIIRALREKADSGVKIVVIHDGSTPPFGFKKLGRKVHCMEGTCKGLMHQKILIVDKEKIWLGSANFTTQSLRMDGNLVIGLSAPALAESIIKRSENHLREFIIAGQRIEYWSLPEDKEEGLERLISLIDTAQKTIRVAMFTWTHPDLTDAIIRAHKRKVRVEVVMDAGQAQGVSEKWFKALKKAHVSVKMNETSDLLHHKFAYIDGKLLVNGSANWTKAAFSKNDDCFLILHDLNEQQVKKMEKLWHAIRSTSIPHEKSPRGSVEESPEPALAA